jgi:hypothetical protein
LSRLIVVVVVVVVVVAAAVRGLISKQILLSRPTLPIQNGLMLARLLMDRFTRTLSPEQVAELIRGMLIFISFPFAYLNVCSKTIGPQKSTDSGVVQVSQDQSFSSSIEGYYFESFFRLIFF